MTSPTLTQIRSVEHEQGTCIVTMQAHFEMAGLPLCGTIVMCFKTPELAHEVGQMIAESSMGSGIRHYEESYIAPNGEKVVLARGRIFPASKKEDLQ